MHAVTFTQIPGWDAFFKACFCWITVENKELEINSVKWIDKEILMWQGFYTHTDTHTCLETERRVASFAQPVCHMACACKSHKCPLSSQPSSFRLPSCGSSFPKLPLLLADYNKDGSFTVWTALLWPGKQAGRHTHTRWSTHNTHNCVPLMQNTHRHHGVLTAGWGWAELSCVLTDWMKCED